MKVKIFEGSIESIESRMNYWLESNPSVKIIETKQNVTSLFEHRSCGDCAWKETVISIWYEEKNEISH
jgi:hypothetical protein